MSTDLLIVEIPSGDSVTITPPESVQLSVESYLNVVETDEVITTVETTLGDTVELHFTPREVEVVEPFAVMLSTVFVNGSGGSGGSSSSFVVSVTDISTLLAYYGGTEVSGWKINKWVGPVKTVATASNNPGLSTLAAAWTIRTLLNYA